MDLFARTCPMFTKRGVEIIIKTLSMQYKSKKTDVVCSIWKRAHGYFSIYVSKTDSAWQETDSKRVNLKGTEVAKNWKVWGWGS